MSRRLGRTPDTIPLQPSIIRRIRDGFQLSVPVLRTLGSAVPLITVVLVAYSLATGQLTALARVLQGYKVEQQASIDTPVQLPHQTRGAFFMDYEKKTFETKQSDESDLPDSIQGTPITWRFEVKGYASEKYTAYYTDTAVDAVLHELCSFNAQTTEDSNGLCAYFAEDCTTCEDRKITVWLDAQDTKWHDWWDAVLGTPGTLVSTPIAVSEYRVKPEDRINGQQSPRSRTRRALSRP